MPEIKRNFVKGKMNKDLDERIVPNGEYRDALNIEVATSDGSDVGTAQNIMGNTRRSSTNSRYLNSAVSIGGSSLSSISENDCITVGTVPNPINNTIVWLQHAHLKVIDVNGGRRQFLEFDRILEHDTKTNSNSGILVDNYRTAVKVNNGKSSNTTNDINISSTGISANGVRVGMTVQCFAPNGDNYWTNPVYTSHFIDADAIVTVKSISGSNITVGVTNHFVNSAWTEDGKGSDITFPSGAILVFEAEKVLNFNEDRLITGINIVDNVLFFTDNENEPKRVSIERSKAGTFGLDSHTILFSNGILQDGSAANPLTYVSEEHITVIKKSPLFPPTLQLSNTTRGDGNKVINTISNYHPIYSAATITANASFSACNTYTGSYDTGSSDFGFLYNPTTGTSYVIDDDPLIPNPVITILVPSNSSYDFLQNDKLILTATSVSGGLAKTHEVNTLVLNSPALNTPLSTTSSAHECYAHQNGLVELELELTSIATSIPLDKDEIISWDVKLDQEKESMFKFKFPRFAYRWKYEDGEYSCFSPFTETAFVPSKFDYMPRKGFNLGMTNEVRLLYLKDFINSETPEDVVEVDLLYKESNAPNIYTVKTLKKEIHTGVALTPADLEWTNDLFSIESDLIYATVEGNQILRPWDNVPRKALGQEIVANRLVFANYLQNYDLIDNAGEVVTPNFGLSVGDVTYTNSNIPKYNVSTPVARMPERSIKSLRTYQIGIVYKDKYGRETPVITSHSDSTTMSLYLEKERATNYNQLLVSNVSGQDLKHPEWADSFKFFIKETSNEYYNLAMDRWYPAEDGNVWLSFPSSDRNKVDSETFIILKKEHDNDTAVESRARYKLLAVENIAPEFITKKKHSYGNVTTSFAATGLPSTDATFVDVAFSSFSSTGLNGTIFPTKQPNLLLRVSSADAKSFWYRINDITEIGSNVRITTEKAFEVDMNFTGDGSGTGAGNPALSLEIVQERKEPTKEFQGRFFVKIHRDVDLETHVLHQTDDQDFIVTDTLRYTALSVSELDYFSQTSDKIYGYDAATSGTIQSSKYPYELLKSAGNPATDFGHKNYLDPIDLQLAKQFWTGERAGAGGNANALHFNFPAESADGVTGEGYVREDAWKRFSWFIDSQWGENPIKNGISYVASKSYNWGEEYLVSEIGAFDAGMSLGVLPKADPSDPVIQDASLFQSILKGVGDTGTFPLAGMFNLTVASAFNSYINISEYTFGDPTGHSSFSDNSIVELGESFVVSPNTSQVVEVYKNLDRNLNENTWKGFTNVDLYPSPGNYPRYAEGLNSEPNNYFLDYSEMDANNDHLDGKYVTVEKNDYVNFAGTNAFKFTAQHDETIVKINTQFQVRPSLDCDPDHPTEPYGDFIGGQEYDGAPDANGDPNLYTQVLGGFNSQLREMIVDGDDFEGMFKDTTVANSLNTSYDSNIDTSTCDTNLIGANGSITQHMFGGGGTEFGKWYRFRNKTAKDNNTPFPEVNDDPINPILNNEISCRRKNVVMKSVGAPGSNRNITGISQLVSVPIPTLVNGNGARYARIDIDYNYVTTGGSASKIEMRANKDAFAANIGSHNYTLPLVNETGTRTMTLDLTGLAGDLVVISVAFLGNHDDCQLEITKVSFQHEKFSKTELHIDVDAPVPGQTFLGTYFDPNITSTNYDITPVATPTVPTITTGGECPGCKFTGTIDGSSPAGMSSFVGDYPVVGGLTGVNARLTLHHNNTSFSSNKATGTVIADESTGFVPEHNGNALCFNKMVASTPQENTGILVRGDHFYAKNDYHLQLILAAVEDVKLNAGESCWIQLESYEKEFDYKHYISEWFFAKIYNSLNMVTGVTPAWIEKYMHLNWDSTDHTKTLIEGSTSGGNINIADARAAANPYYRIRGSYGGPIEIVEGNENSCNLEQDFVHDLITPQMELQDNSTGDNNLGKITHPVWGDAQHPSSTWNMASVASKNRADYFDPMGIGFTPGTEPWGSNKLWNDTFQTKDRSSRLFGGIALPAGFGTTDGDFVTTSVSGVPEFTEDIGTVGYWGLNPWKLRHTAEWHIAFGSSPRPDISYASGGTWEIDMWDVNGMTSFYPVLGFGSGIIPLLQYAAGSPYNEISIDSPIDRIPEKFLTQFELDQWDEDSTTFRSKGYLSGNNTSSSGGVNAYDVVSSSMYNHKHPAFKNIFEYLFHFSAATAVNTPDSDKVFLAGATDRSGPPPVSFNSTYQTSFLLYDRFTWKAMSSGNFINFSFQWDPADKKHDYGYPLLFPFHKLNNGANYNYDPTSMPNIGNWNTRDTDHEDITGWVGTRIAVDDATITINANHTYTAQTFDSSLDINSNLFSDKMTSYKTDLINSPLFLPLSQEDSVITIKSLVFGGITNSYLVGWKIIEFDDDGLNPVGGMFKVDTIVTAVSAEYSCAGDFCVDISLSKIPNMTAAYTFGGTFDPKITFVNTTADVLLHPTPWKDDLRAIYFPPEEDGVIDNSQSWYDDCYHHISSAIPNITGSRDFSGYGLYDSGKKLHLSFGGINNTIENWKKSAYNLGVFHPELSSNLWNLKSNGTLFRFKDDPNKCIFKIKSSVNSFDQNTNGIGIRNYMPAYTNTSEEDWDHPSFNATHLEDDVKDPYNKRVRFYLSIEYTGWNVTWDGTTTSATGDYVFNPEAEVIAMGIGHKDNTSANAADFPELTHNPVLGTESNPVATNLFDSSDTAYQGEMYSTMEFVAPDWDGSEDFTSANPAIWETEPKEDLDLDIYYEASPSYPVKLNGKNAENYFRGNYLTAIAPVIVVTDPSGNVTSQIILDTVTEEAGEIILEFTSAAITATSMSLTNVPVLRFTSQDGSYVEAKIKRHYYSATNWAKKSSVEITSPTDEDTKFGLPYFNCFSFGNGVESDRIRDDFNAVTIGKGVKVSTTQGDVRYKEERRKNSFIFSGIYNSNSGINKLNQFITIEDITKELNPVYGSIQKLHTRDTDLTAFCEDKVLRVLANKDALFNADGNFQLTSNKNVLGQAVPYSGEYGIGTHPESFASYGYRSYFVDKNRGCVLRLSRDGVEVVSNYGMKDYFRDKLDNDIDRILGSYDPHAGNYDVTIRSGYTSDATISFNEQTNGWVSFKSYLPNMGVYLDSSYYTFKHGEIFSHYTNNFRNNFYTSFSTLNELHYNSTISFLFNESPNVVKSFNTLNYEGSVARITADPPSTAQELLDGVSYHSHDGSKPPSGYGEYYNNTGLEGWHVPNVETNLQSGTAIEFKDKEGKYFTAIKGETTNWEAGDRPGNVDTNEFSVQGIGNAMKIEAENPTGAPQEYSLAVNADCWTGAFVYGCTDPLAINYNPQANVDDGSCCLVSGCMVPVASNYDPSACFDDGSCLGVVYGCTDPTAFNYSSNYNWPLTTVACDPGPGLTPANCCCYISGCNDASALNTDPNACHNDGSCIAIVYGCTDSGSTSYWDKTPSNWDGSFSSYPPPYRPNGYSGAALNYYAGANLDDPTNLLNECCYVSGCMENDPGFSPDTNGYGYDAVYNCDLTTGGSRTVPTNVASISPCPFPCSSDGTTNGTPHGYESENYNPCACISDGNCIKTYGCTNPNAINYNSNATIDDGNCCLIQGCMDNTEGPWPNYAGACRDGFVPATPTIVGQDPQATLLRQCDYGCTVDGYAYAKCGWSTYNTFNPDACNNGTGVVNNPGNINYSITQAQWDYNSGTATGGNLVVNNITDDAESGYETEDWCFTPTYGCFDLTAGDNPDVFGNCSPGNGSCSGTGCCSNGTGYLASNTNAPDWCHDANNLDFPYNSGRPNNALTSYKSSTGNCIGHTQTACVIYGCTNPVATNYIQTATIDDGSCIIPAYQCPATSLYWPAETLSSNGEFLETDFTDLYAPNSGTPVANFYAASGTLGTISTWIGVTDQIFEKYMDDICLTDGGLDPILYAQVGPDGTTCTDCVYRGWSQAGTTLEYCIDWDFANWDFNTPIIDNCVTWSSYDNLLAPDGSTMNNKDNELSVPYVDTGSSISNNYQDPKWYTHIGYDKNAWNPSRQEGLGAVAGVMHHLEYLNMDYHLVNDAIPTRDMIRLKEISLHDNIVGYHGIRNTFKGSSTLPGIFDLVYATDLEKINFGNYQKHMSMAYGPQNNPGYSYASQGHLRLNMDGQGSGWTYGSEAISTKRSTKLSGYQHIFNNDNVWSQASKFGNTRGNSVIHGLDCAGSGNCTDAFFPGQRNNMINYILNTSGSNDGLKFINLKYLNINNQVHAQQWLHFYTGSHMNDLNWLTSTSPWATINPAHIQLDLSKQTKLEELHMQASPVASIYFNNGFESGYYPETYDSYTVGSDSVDLLHTDFAVLPQLKVVDTRNSQLFAHVNFSYNRLLEKLYVGRGYFQEQGRALYNSHVFLPYIEMIDAKLGDIISNESVPHFDDNQTIINHSDGNIMAPTFDFKANPSSLRELWILGEKVGGSQTITSLDRKGSGLVSAECHSCDDAVGNIFGPLTGNSGEQSVRMDIGNPLELVSMRELNDINLRIWTNGAIAVDEVGSTVPIISGSGSTSNQANAGKSHVYFGRADVTLDNSHGSFIVHTDHFNRANSSKNVDINTQSEIYGLDETALAATRIVPGARLSEISLDAGGDFFSVLDVGCYVVSVNKTSIKLSHNIGSFINTVKGAGYANLTNGSVTQSQANITYAVNPLNTNEITITGNNLRVKFTMDTPDWGRPDMYFKLRSVNDHVYKTEFEGWNTASNVNYKFGALHPAITGQFQVSSDIVLHFGSSNNVDNFVLESGVQLGSNGKVISLPTDPRYNFTGMIDRNIVFETKQQCLYGCSLPPVNYITNIYCVI